MAREKWEISAFGWDGFYGVYCIFTTDKDGKNKLHYIGSSINIGKRIANRKHPYMILWDNDMCAFIKYKQTDNYLELEKELIGRLNPPMNKQHTKIRL